MKILIANRSAIARRIVRAVREMGHESVVVYSEADALSPYLAEADHACALVGNTALETYLNQDALLQAARDSGADAVHPGYGFLAENADFATGVIEAGMRFIGPAPEWLARMGDKVAARQLMAGLNFPVFAGSELLADATAAARAAQDIGYPVLLKPSGGGGGMGMEIVHDADALADAFARSQAVARAAFDDPRMYLEQWIDRPRHIEYQILADGKGRAMHLYERDCSIQRRNQKLIEESPAPGIAPAYLEEQARLAAAACARLGYDNVGTLETLYTRDGESGFLEMNTRIQVEHGVTELVTGVDLVQAQIALSEGQALPAPAERQGYAIEVRLYAEDSHTLLPSTGRLAVFRPPQLTGVRIETGYQEGQSVTPFYDPLLAKILAHGTTREMAIGRVLVALKAFEVSGVQTNAQLLMRVLKDPTFLAGQVDTGLLARILEPR
ncbi:MAG: biotin carboxylase N-terminal domain-containing protein [Pseudomonadota bacterium]